MDIYMAEKLHSCACVRTYAYHLNLLFSLNVKKELISKLSTFSLLALLFPPWNTPLLFKSHFWHSPVHFNCALTPKILTGRTWVGIMGYYLGLCVFPSKIFYCLITNAWLKINTFCYPGTNENIFLNVVLWMTLGLVLWLSVVAWSDAFWYLTIRRHLTSYL